MTSRPTADTIIIRDLLVRGIVGIKPEERSNRQDILINLRLHVDVRAAASSDDISDAVNYRSIAKRVIQHVETSADHLVEKLASDLAGIILDEYAVLRAVVRVEKPGALRFAASVGVEVDRQRQPDE